MKKIIKLICLILSLIFVLTTAGCDLLWDLMIPKIDLSSEKIIKEWDDFLYGVELETEGYMLVASETPLSFCYSWSASPGIEKLPKIAYHLKSLYYETFEFNGEKYFYERPRVWTPETADGETKSIYLMKGDGKIIEENDNGVLIDSTPSYARYIDGEYLSTHSESARKIYERFPNLTVQGVILFDGKLFLYASQSYITNSIFVSAHPPMIFEYDYDTEIVKYAGFLPNYQYYEKRITDVEINGEYFNYKPIEYMAKIQKTN